MNSIQVKADRTDIPDSQDYSSSKDRQGDMHPRLGSGQVPGCVREVRLWVDLTAHDRETAVRIIAEVLDRVGNFTVIGAEPISDEAERYYRRDDRPHHIPPQQAAQRQRKSEL